MTAPQPGDLWVQVHTGEVLVVVEVGAMVVSEATDDEGTTRWEVALLEWQRLIGLPDSPWRRVEVPTDASVYAAISEAGARGASAAEAIIGALGCAESVPMVSAVLRAMALRGGA